MHCWPCWFVPLLALAPSWIRPAFDVPQPLADALAELRSAPLDETPAASAKRIEAILGEEASSASALVLRLMDPATREPALEEIAQEDLDEAARIRAALPREQASEQLVRSLVGPFVQRHIERPVNASLSARLRKLSATYEKELRPVLELAPRDSKSTREKKLRLVDEWRVLIHPALSAVRDMDGYSDADHGASGQAEIDKRVRRLWQAHLRLKVAVDEDLQDLLVPDPAQLLEHLVRADALGAVWKASAKAVAGRDSIRVKPLDLSLGSATRMNCARALVLFLNAEPKAAREALADGDDYDEVLLVFAFRALVEQYNDRLVLEEMDEPDRYERDVTRRINDYRLALELAPLEVDACLTRAARGHSKEMLELGYFAHDSPIAEHRSFADRTRLAGYMNSNVAECIFAGSRPDAENAFLAWFDSSSHHRLMTSDDYRQIGVGRAEGIFTANFGGGWVLRR